MREHRTLAKNYLCICLAMLLCSCGGPSPSHIRFMRRGPKYYSQLASDCDSLLQTASAAELARSNRIPGSSTNLPAMIKGLHPNYVLLKTNGVLIKIGEGRTGYAVEWARNSAYPSQWDLETSAEGQLNLLFSDRRPTPWPPQAR
jgi:hypothetical protein